MVDRDQALASEDWSALVRRMRAQTPARLLAGRSGGAYRTETQMELRAAHACARDAVRSELDPQRDLGGAFLEQWKLFEVSTQAPSKDDYLLRPDLGRRFSVRARARISECCPAGQDLQVVIGDGLSVAAVAAQVPALVPLLFEEAGPRGWSCGQIFLVRHCRVGILNEIGELLQPQVVVLLIGERPGLATAESLSAYLGYQPRSSHTDANRNLISNIHSRGVLPRQAATRIVNLAAQMIEQRTSGCDLREELSALRPGDNLPAASSD